MKKSLIAACILTFIGLTSLAQDSLNMTKLSVWKSQNAVEYNDVWGYTDDNGREYAILGSNWGTHFLDVTDPRNPVEINSFAGFNTNVIWRDFKIVGHYAYGVADNYWNSLQIFDLSNLPSSVSVVYDDDLLSESCHNIYIEGNRAYMASNLKNDTIHALDVLGLDDPAYPFLLKRLDNSYFGFCDGCLHDIYVKNNIAYCSAGYSGLFMYDLTDLENPVLLGSITSYSDQGYNHSSWVHEDGEILVMADEVPNSLALKSHDISDIANPIELATFESSDSARPHNPFFVKNDLYVSYYYDGLQVFDFTDPANPVQSAFYDTYPENDTMSTSYPDEFDGAWGVYPFFESKNIAVADITHGLFMITKERDIYTELEEISICDNPDSVVTINFYAKGDFNSGNKFYLELADNAMRRFITPTIVDSISADTAGNYSFTFDPSGFFNDNFRFRISSSDPNLAQSSWLDLTYGNTPNKPTITLSGNELSVLDNAQLYKWYVNDELQIGANSSTFYYNGDEASIYVEAYNGGCFSTSDAFQITTDNVEEKNELININIFPNPSNEIFNVFNFHKKELKFEIFNSKGAFVSEFTSNERMIKFKLESGMYFVKISDGKSQKTNKLVVF